MKVACLLGCRSSRWLRRSCHQGLGRRAYRLSCEARLSGARIDPSRALGVDPFQPVSQGFGLDQGAPQLFTSITRLNKDQDAANAVEVGSPLLAPVASTGHAYGRYASVPGTVAVRFAFDDQHVAFLVRVF